MVAQAHGLLFGGGWTERKEGCTSGCCTGTGQSKGMKQAVPERVRKAQRYKASISPITIKTKQLELDMSISTSFLHVYINMLAV